MDNYDIMKIKYFVKLSTGQVAAEHKVEQDPHQQAEHKAGQAGHKPFQVEQAGHKQAGQAEQVQRRQVGQPELFGWKSRQRNGP